MAIGHTLQCTRALHGSGERHGRCRRVHAQLHRGSHNARLSPRLSPQVALGTVALCLCCITCLVRKLTQIMEEDDDDGPVSAQDDEMELVPTKSGFGGHANGHVPTRGLVGSGLAGAGAACQHCPAGISEWPGL